VKDQLVGTKNDCQFDFKIRIMYTGLSVGCDIDDKWEPVYGTCIKLFQLDRNWKDSRYYSIKKKLNQYKIFFTISSDECLNQGGDLVVVKNSQTQDYLRDLLKIYKKPVWIGLSDLVRYSSNIQNKYFIHD
jgi:hypothetical protein